MKFCRNSVALFVILFTIISCTPKEKNNLSTHKIVFLTDYFEEYIKAAKGHDKKYRDSCLRKIKENIFIRYFSKCEIPELFTEEDTTLHNLDIDELAGKTELVKANRETIIARIDTALVKCFKHLPYDGVSIFIGPSSLKKQLSEMMGGVDGFTPGSKHILLFIDPYIKGWEDMLEIALAHEFNHAYWIKHTSSYGGTLLEWMVCEGKAETFSHLVYPNIKEPWDSTLTAVQKKELWDTIRPKLSSTDNKLGADIMFGNNGYPRCCGYILGRDIVTAALKQNPTTEAKNWTNFSADFILKASGYK